MMNSSPAVFPATLLLAPTVLAARSTDFAAMGTLPPIACEPIPSGAGVVDY